MTDHLVAIDLQNIFAAGPWGAPRFADVVPRVQQLAARFGPRAMFTRFVAPDRPSGSWVEYFEQWPFARQAPDSAEYQLVDAFAGRVTLDAPTFGKWDVLRPRVSIGDTLYVCGVSTDCCVVATVLAAADAGMRIRLVADACAGATEVSHAHALELMALFAPQVEIVETAGVLAG